MGRGLTQATPRFDPQINFQINGAELEIRSTDADYDDNPGLLGHPRGERGSARTGGMEAGWDMPRSWGPVSQKCFLLASA